MTNSIKDVCEDSQVILLVGSNPEEAHPVMGMRLRQAVERGAKLIVVDPREIGLAKKADIHLKLRPGTNVAFANGMVNVLIQKGVVAILCCCGGLNWGGKERSNGKEMMMVEKWPGGCSKRVKFDQK